MRHVEGARPNVAKVWRSEYMSSVRTPARLTTLAQISRRTLEGFIGRPVRVAKMRASPAPRLLFR